jgi:hypothetical protein
LNAGQLAERFALITADGIQRILKFVPLNLHSSLASLFQLVKHLTRLINTVALAF